MEKPIDGPVLFYMPNAKYGELCQWFPCTFKVNKPQISALIGQPNDDAATPGDYISFNCAEQFMMYCKAGRFHDTKTQQRIMATADPKEQKLLGKETAGFCDVDWDEVKSAVVVAGNIAKFGQNKKLKGKLLATGDRLLAEAASRDRVWGIGFNANRAMEHRDKWGENRLGLALMEVREHLRREPQDPSLQENDSEDDSEDLMK